MKVKRVINLFAGPGVGKSTIAAGLFHLMKMCHCDVELAYEFAKELVYEGRFQILSEDQLLIFAEQNRRLMRLRNNVEYIVSDSPLALTAIYFNPETNVCSEYLLKALILDTANKYPNLNILLKRNPGLPYSELGRNQTQQEAIEIDKQIEKFLQVNRIPYIEVLSGENSIDEIWKHLNSVENLHK